VPALIPVRLTLLRVATPLASVVALPTLVPLRVKLTLAPLTAVPLEVSVAESVVVPPKLPVVGATVKLVAAGVAAATPSWITETVPLLPKSGT
jgi:hypothetical protein